MHMTASEFLAWDSKKITLLGMSGVGKTRLSQLLPQNNWFHYSGDYRIGTRYLQEPILDNIKKQAMKMPFLRELLLSDSIYICNNISINNLSPVSSFLGKLGNHKLNGISLEEFQLRQKQHHDAEVNAMLDVPQFIDKAQDIYGYKHFLNDAGGSICELSDPSAIECLAEHTLIIYLRIDQKQQQTLIERAKQAPKPLFYRPEFLLEQLAIYMKNNQLESTNEIDPDDFVSWVFPQLFHARIPRYQKIADQYGYSIDVQATEQVIKQARGANNEQGFVNMIAEAIDASN